MQLLNKVFCDEYRQQYEKFCHYVLENRSESEKFGAFFRKNEEKIIRTVVRKLFDRLIFLMFLQSGGWLNRNSSFLMDLFSKCDHLKDDFLDSVLKPLFFKGFSERHSECIYDTGISEIGRVYIPYLSLKLFEKKSYDGEKIVFPAIFWEELLSFFQRYSFSLDETEQTGKVITPQALGTVFEILLESNEENGTYYTPDEVVRYMCRESLIAYLVNSQTDERCAAIRRFVEYKKTEELSQFEGLLKEIDERLYRVTVCDPAVGAGAFVIGMHKLLYSCRKALAPEMSSTDLSLQIAENNLYGVDIDGDAVDIARQRLLLAVLRDMSPENGFPDVEFKLMQGNSLCECYENIELNALEWDEATAKNGKKVELSQMHLSFSQKDDICSIQACVKQYSEEKTPHRKRQILNHLNASVCRYIEHARDEKSKNAKLSIPNNKFFLWHLYFSEIFDKGGFDIVIANPPYGVRMSAQEKAVYAKHYNWLQKRYDIYMVFLELGLMLMKHVMCYITPDKWLSKSFGLGFREHCMVPYMTSILHLGNAVFDTAMVDAVVSVFEKPEHSSLSILKSNDHNDFHIVQTIDKCTLATPYSIDQYFLGELPSIIAKLERFPHRLGDYAKCEYASVSPKDAYALKAFIKTDKVPENDVLKLITTGLIGKYRNRWSMKKMRYLKEDYEYPVVSVEDLTKNFGKSYVRRMQSPKLIIKGLNLLDCSVDLRGECMSTVATLNIRSDSEELLKMLSAVINSTLMTEYCKAKYVTSSYCGGLEFTPEMINNLPVPDLSDLSEWQIVIDLVSEVLDAEEDSDTSAKIKEIDVQICRRYGITEYH